MQAVLKQSAESSIISMEHENIFGQSLKLVRSAKTDLPDMMIFHDSFYTTCLDEYMEPSFSTSMSMAYGEAGLKNHLDIIAAEKPDIVIVEFVERQIEYFYRYLSK